MWDFKKVKDYYHNIGVALLEAENARGLSGHLIKLQCHNCNHVWSRRFCADGCGCPICRYSKVRDKKAITQEEAESRYLSKNIKLLSTYINQKHKNDLEYIKVPTIIEVRPTIMQILRTCRSGTNSKRTYAQMLELGL